MLCWKSAHPYAIIFQWLGNLSDTQGMGVRLALIALDLIKESYPIGVQRWVNWRLTSFDGYYTLPSVRSMSEREGIGSNPILVITWCIVHTRSYLPH